MNWKTTMHGSTTGQTVVRPPIDGVKVLGITGHAGHGKDMLAKFLLRAVPGSERFAFSDALSAKLRLERRMWRRNPPQLQHMMDEVSREGVRDAVYFAIDDKRPPLAIVTGVRFYDEVEMIRGMGGSVVRVRRVDEDDRPYVSPDRDPKHPVEQHIPNLPVDAEVVAKSGDHACLEMIAKRLAEGWRG